MSNQTPETQQQPPLDTDRLVQSFDNITRTSRLSMNDLSDISDDDDIDETEGYYMVVPPEDAEKWGAEPANIEEFEAHGDFSDSHNVDDADIVDETV